MLDRLPRILRPPQQQRITPRRLPLRQLIQRQALAASLQNARARRVREPERRDAEFRQFQRAGVVRHGPHHDDRLVLVLVFGLLGRGGRDDAGDGDGGAVGLGHVEAAEDGFVEGGVGAACVL